MFAPVPHRYGNVTQDGIHVPLTRDTFAGRASAAWFLRLCAFCAESEKTAKFPEKRRREKGPALRWGQCLMSQSLWLQTGGQGRLCSEAGHSASWREADSSPGLWAQLRTEEV